MKLCGLDRDTTAEGVPYEHCPSDAKGLRKPDHPAGVAFEITPCRRQVGSSTEARQRRGNDRETGLGKKPQPSAIGVVTQSPPV